MLCPSSLRPYINKYKMNEWRKVPTRIDEAVNTKVILNKPDRGINKALESPFIDMFKSLEQDNAVLLMGSRIENLLREFAATSNCPIDQVKRAYDEVPNLGDYYYNDNDYLDDFDARPVPLYTVTRTLADFLRRKMGEVYESVTGGGGPPPPGGGGGAVAMQQGAAVMPTASDTGEPQILQTNTRPDYDPHTNFPYFKKRVPPGLAASAQRREQQTRQAKSAEEQARLAEAARAMEARQMYKSGKNKVSSKMGLDRSTARFQNPLFRREARHDTTTGETPPEGVLIEDIRQTYLNMMRWGSRTAQLLVPPVGRAPVGRVEV